MSFVNKTLDVGTTINAYFVNCTDVTRFEKVVIHLGSFYYLKVKLSVNKIRSRLSSKTY